MSRFRAQSTVCGSLHDDGKFLSSHRRGWQSHDRERRASSSYLNDEELPVDHGLIHIGKPSLTRLQLMADDKLIPVFDGIAEAMDSDVQLFCFERLTNCSLSIDELEIEVTEAGEFRQTGGDVPRADRTVVCRAMGVPRLHKPARPHPKAVPAVGVSNFENVARHAFTRRGE